MNECCAPQTHTLPCASVARFPHPDVDRSCRWNRAARSASSREAVVRLARAVFRRLARAIRAARRRRRAQRDLLNLDERMLRDIGMTQLDYRRLTGRDPASAHRSGHWLTDTQLHR